MKPKQQNQPHLTKPFTNLKTTTTTQNLNSTINSLEHLLRKGHIIPSKSIAQILQQCANTKSLKQGKWVHLYLRLTGFKYKPHTYISNHLINMYTKCGCDKKARQVFNKMSVKNLYSWNNMLSGYAKQGLVIPAQKLFDEMPQRDVVSYNTMLIMYAKHGYLRESLNMYNLLRREGIGVNEFTYSGILIACNGVEIRVSKQVHAQVLVLGFVWNMVILNSLVDVYAKSGLINDAKKVFDEMEVRDVLAWTTMVSGYAKVGDMDMARRLFDEMPERNPISWTTLISGYVRSGICSEALKFFSEMMVRGIRPDQFTFSSSLCACASMALLKLGKEIHSHLIRTVLRPNTIVVSSLVDMYSKCGNLASARSVFTLMGDKLDVVLWNTMLSSLSQHGLGEECLQLFHDLVRVGVKPNGITLVVMLIACRYSGLVEEGNHLFEVITKDYGISADQQHYACLVDLFGRAGRFKEVKGLLEKMPCKPDGEVWNALLGVCKIHNNTELGRIAAEHLIDIEPQSSGGYALTEKWDSVEKVRHLMSERKVKKEQDLSWIEVESKVHSFTVFDESHPLKDKIYMALEQLAGQMDDETILHGALEFCDLAIISKELR